MTETTALVGTYKTPAHFKDIFRQGGSRAGYHAISSWLECPERTRLRATGLVPKNEQFFENAKLNARDFGTLLHTLHAERLLFGHTSAVVLLNRFVGDGLGDEDAKNAAMMLSVMETTYPLESDPLKVLACEPEVITDIGDAERSVRYDTIVRSPDGALFSLEVKSMSRGGMSATQPYYAQAYVQVAIWNANRHLVNTYGPMTGVIFECLVKTKLPSVDRRPPLYVTKLQQKMAIEYMKSNRVQYTIGEDGSFPKMLHSCWGRWRPCEYIAWCHEQSFGEYTTRTESEAQEEG